MNGTFVLNEVTPGVLWSGPGAEFTIPFIGTFQTNIDVVCPVDVFVIDYRDDGGVGGTLVWFNRVCESNPNCPPPPPFTAIPNGITDCSTQAGNLGTASITVP